MKIERFILSILRKIESLRGSIITYAYKTGNRSKTYEWWEISVSDFDFYMHDKRFRILAKAWHKAALAQGYNIVFVCSMPKEAKLVKLAEEENLILNI